MIRALAITGPTASGKTALSIALSERVNAEIICCDSMQIYKRMDVGTAKATQAERLAVPHHMLDILSPSEPYSVEAYRTGALEAARDISSRGRVPMFVGGTGLYIDALMRAPSQSVPESSPEYRERLLASVKSEEDAEVLWQRLMAVDPESAAAIHKNNLRRVIRALEIYETTGKTKSYFDALSKATSPDISVGMITLDFHNRENLYSRVNARVDAMMDGGLEMEVRALYSDGYLQPSSTASQAIGYKEMLAYIRGETALSEAVELIKLSTRRYAKRQLTWFRHETEAYRLYLDGEDGELRALADITEEALRAVNHALQKF